MFAILNLLTFSRVCFLNSFPGFRLCGSWQCLSLLCFAASFPAAYAQENPFGGNPFGAASGDPAVSNPFGGGGDVMGVTDPAFGGFGNRDADFKVAAPKLEQGELDDPNPVVRMLREDPPKTPQRMAEGLSWMVRIKRWDEVKRLLDLATASGWSEEQLAALAQAAGPSLWLRLGNPDAELSSEHRELINTIQASPARLARQPEWIDSWIAKLASPRAGERRLAQLRLQDGGRAAIVRLLDRLMAGGDTVDSALLASTVAGFGPDGVDALKAACLVADPDRAARVYLALAELPEKDFVMELGAGLISFKLPSEAKGRLANKLAGRFERVPSPEAISDYLAKEFDSRLDAYQQLRMADSQQIDLIWRLSADGNSVEPHQVPLAERRLEELARAAAHRLQSSISTLDDLVDSSAAALQRAYRVSPGLAMGELDAAVLAGFNSEEQADTLRSPGHWIRVFQRASELQMHGGSLRALQLFAESASENDPTILSFLSESLDDSRPMVRYAALQSLAKVDPKSDFIGAEQALETAVEMVRLKPGPHVLVIGLQADLRQAAQEQLQQQANASVTAVNSARAALLELASPKPFELIVIVDRVADQSLYEFLQRLRATQKGHSLPIAVLTDEIYQHERTLIAESGGMLHSVLSRNSQQMRRVIDRMLDALDTEPLGPGDRAEFAVAAGQFLSRIASDRERYAFYQISRWDNELRDLSGQLLRSSQIDVLSGLGSAKAQIELTELVSSGQLEKSSQQAAAMAFGRSVRRFGLKLSRKDVRQLYDRYNTIGPTEPAIAKSLGLVLDVLEAHAGKTDWPAGL